MSDLAQEIVRKIPRPMTLLNLLLMNTSHIVQHQHINSAGPGLLVLGKLVLQELGNFVANIMRDVVSCQETTQETKLRSFIFPQRSQASDQVAHGTDERGACY